MESWDVLDIFFSQLWKKAALGRKDTRCSQFQVTADLCMEAEFTGIETASCVTTCIVKSRQQQIHNARVIVLSFSLLSTYSRAQTMNVCWPPLPCFSPNQSLSGMHTTQPNPESSPLRLTQLILHCVKQANKSNYHRMWCLFSCPVLVMDSMLTLFTLWLYGKGDSHY